MTQKTTCAAMTKSGRKCTNLPFFGVLYCKQHKMMMDRKRALTQLERKNARTPGLTFGPFRVDIAGPDGEKTVVFCNQCDREVDRWEIEWRSTCKVAHSYTGWSGLVPDKPIAKLKVRCHHDELEVTL